MIYQMEITQMNVHAYLIPSLLKLEKGFFQAQEEVPGWSNEEKLEGSLVKLELLTEERLVESLVGLKLLAERKMDPSLVKLDLLLEKGMV
jgi:hypothetical protein